MSNKNYVSKRFTAMLLMVIMILAMIPYPSVAATRWNLEGWRVNQTKWIGGNLFDWSEDDYVPYRLVAKAYEYDGDTIAIQHDYQDADGHFGIDGAIEWFIGPIVPDSTPIEDITPYFVEGDFSISDPVIIEGSNSKIIEYTLVPSEEFLTELSQYTEWALYWKAHLSRTGSQNLSFPSETIQFGSSYWNGASLHAHTTVTGNQDVPIQTPETIAELPAIQIEKLTNGVDADLPAGPEIPVGSSVTWSYIITNTGNVTLNNIVVTDDQGEIVTIPKTSLAPGESMTGTATGIAVSGQYTNIGTVTGLSPEGTEVSDSDPSHYFGYVPAAPGIDIEKFTNGQNVTATPGPSIPVGTTVTWTYIVTNTGNVPLTDISITDDQGVVVSIPKTTLDPGESMTGTASGLSTLGQYTNIGTATGTPPQGPNVTDSDTSYYLGFIPDAPGIDIEKFTNGQDADTSTGPMIKVGDPVTWTYVVTNTGNVTLSNVVVIDDQGVTVTAPKTVLAPGESMTATASGIATEGQYVNIGTVTGTPPEGSNVTDSDPSHYFGFNPSISINKTTNDSDGPNVQVGDAITWTYLVTNTGNIALTNIEVTDDKEGLIGTIAVLAPQASATLTASGTASDGNYTNTGTAKGWYSEGQDSFVTNSDDSSYTGYVPDDPSIRIDKTTNGTDGPDLEIGSTVTWSYLVTNTGNVTLYDIEVTDNQEGTIGTIASLAPQATATLTKTGIALEGNYTNTGTAKGWYDESDEAFVMDSDQSSYTGFNPAEPGISIIKTTNGSDGLRIRVGNSVTWEYKVETINGFSIYGVEVNDSDSNVNPLYISGDDGDEVLEPGETWIYRATGTAIRGNYENTGYAEGWSNQEVKVNDQDDSNYEGYVPSTPRPDPDPGRITIFKFLDANNNGDFDTDELSMNNIVFQLYDEDKDLLDSESTNDNGRLSFSNLDAGTYFIKEVRGDYTITTDGFDNDGFYEVDVDEDETVTIEVGNYREVVIPEEPPLGPPPVIEEVEEEAPPLAIPALPKTGELPPYFSYGFGSLLVLAGLFMKRKF